MSDKELWAWIKWWMNDKRISPSELAKQIGYPQDRIEKGISGDPQPILYKLDELLCAFNPISARGKYFEEGYEILTEKEKLDCLRPPALKQGNFWDANRS